MAASGPTPKLMLFLDLDFTHFNSSMESVVWLGQKQDWQNFYHELIALAHSHGVEMLFAVVTNKQSFDDIAEEAAVSFKDLLSIDNPSMYFTDAKGLEWCLVKNNKVLKEECINYKPADKEGPPSFFKQKSRFTVSLCDYPFKKKKRLHIRDGGASWHSAGMLFAAR